MRIGIDARLLDPHGSGLSRYVERLVTHLAARDHENDYVVWLRPGIAWEPHNPRWEIRRAGEHWYTIREQLVMPWRFLAGRVDLLHIPHFNIPVLYPRPFVVTIHDLILNQFPTERSSTLEPILFKIKHAAYHIALVQAIRRARQIISVSAWSKEQLIKTYRRAIGKTTVTYEAADALPSASPMADLAKKNITQPYFLYAGNTYPHKNLERLVDAFRTVQRAHPETTLVLVGKRDYFSHRLESYVRAGNIPNVVFFGYATDHELHGLYKNCHAYVFPSLSEGFGLPGLEAMLAGALVLAGNATCLPEVLGDAARYFNPHNTDNIAQVMIDSLEHPEQRGMMIERGYAQVAKYSWERMADETRAIYERANTKA